MDPVIALLIVLVIYLWYRLSIKKPVVVAQTVMPTGIYPFEKIDALLSTSELRFYNLLRSTVGDKYHINVKVDMEAVINVKRNISASARKGYMEKVTGQFADFVLCRAQDMKVICVVVLDQKGEFTPEEKERVDYVDKAFKAASMALIRFKLTGNYNEAAIVAALKKGINDAMQSKQEEATE